MTKRIIIFLMSLIFLTSAFLNAQANKTLVVYFSYSGNTKITAEYVREILNADIFEIIPANRYHSDYNATVNQYRRERGTLPRLVNGIKELCPNSTILKGFSIYGK